MNKDFICFNDQPVVGFVRPFFPWMLAISLALHVVFAIVITGGDSGHHGDPTINFIDLTMSEQSAAVTPKSPAPSEMAAPDKDAVVPPVEQSPPLPTESEKLQQEAQNAVQSASEQPEAMQKVSFGLGLLKGHFGTIADGRSLRDDMRDYHLSLLRAINENWWRSGNKYEGMNSAVVNIIISRSGEVINAQIMQSSGNPSYDKTMVKSLLGTGPLPPLPPHFDSPVFIAPIRFNPPLTLFGSPTVDG